MVGRDEEEHKQGRKKSAHILKDHKCYKFLLTVDINLMDKI